MGTSVRAGMLQARGGSDVLVVDGSGNAPTDVCGATDRPLTGIPSGLMRGLLQPRA